MTAIFDLSVYGKMKQLIEWTCQKKHPEYKILFVKNKQYQKLLKFPNSKKFVTQTNKKYMGQMFEKKPCSVCGKPVLCDIDAMCSGKQFTNICTRCMSTTLKYKFLFTRELNNYEKKRLACFTKTMGNPIIKMHIVSSILFSKYKDIHNYQKIEYTRKKNIKTFDFIIVKSNTCMHCKKQWNKYIDFETNTIINKNFCRNCYIQYGYKIITDNYHTNNNHVYRTSLSNIIEYCYTNNVKYILQENIFLLIDENYYIDSAFNVSTLYRKHTKREKQIKDNIQTIILDELKLKLLELYNTLKVSHLRMKCGATYDMEPIVNDINDCENEIKMMIGETEFKKYSNIFFKTFLTI